MKKLFLILIMLITFCSCGNTPKDEPRDLGYLGTWYFDSIEQIEKYPFNWMSEKSLTIRGIELSFSEEQIQFPTNEIPWDKDILVNYNYDEKINAYVFKTNIEILGRTFYENRIKIKSYNDEVLIVEHINYLVYDTNNKKEIYGKGEYKLSKSLKGSFDEEEYGEYKYAIQENTDNEYVNVLNCNKFRDSIPLLNKIDDLNERLLIKDNEIYFKNNEICFDFNNKKARYVYSENENNIEYYYEITIFIRNEVCYIDLTCKISGDLEIYDIDGELINSNVCYISFRLLTNELIYI